MIEEFLKNPAGLTVTGLLIGVIGLFLRNTIMLVKIHEQRVAEYEKRISEIKLEYKERSAEVIGIYRERLDTANLSAMEWRTVAEGLQRALPEALRKYMVEKQ